MRPMNSKMPKPDDPKAIVESLGELDSGELAAKGFDAEKVARIRKAMREGTFKVDAKAVADALLVRARKAAGRRK
jgi:flagellar biosynthesis anti-sigma factor FlgM